MPALGAPALAQRHAIPNSLWLQLALLPEPKMTLLHHILNEWDLNGGFLVATDLSLSISSCWYRND